jgi:diguanylate cyclase (GGDEF)-like protein
MTIERYPLRLHPRSKRRQRIDSIEDARRAFRQVRDLLCAGSRIAAEQQLVSIEEVVCSRLRELEEAAFAVADANARSVEIVEQQRQLRIDVERQYLQIAQQNEQIRSQQREIEERANALAEANVEAVLLLDGTNQQLQRVTELRDSMERNNLELVRRTRQLESETLALAEANAVAVEMLDHRDEQVTMATSELAELIAQNDELHRKVSVDDLTGLLNHRFFSEQVSFEVARAQRYGRALSLLFVDVDHFKNLNDNHGHITGNVVLKRVAALLRQQVRTSDLPLRADGSPFAARYGGEEFVVILPETDAAGARTCAERLCACVAMAELPGGETQPLGRVTISIGVATLHGDEDAHSLVRRADAALYSAKRNGRNRVAMAEEEACGDSSKAG